MAATHTTTAVTFARQAPHAGFLQKQGANVREFKRRFFVLQPATHLYYFLSAQDTAPRGCFDLEGARIEHDILDDSSGHNNASCANGIYRFAIVWDGGGGDNCSTGNTPAAAATTTTSSNRVLLEARSKQDALEWIRALEQERLPYVKNALTKAQRKISAYASRVTELERNVADLKLVEQDRDGAIEDAAKWRAQFAQLDESIRRLTQQLRRRPLVRDTAAASDHSKREETSPRPDDIPDDETGVTVATTTEDDGDDEPMHTSLEMQPDVCELDASGEGQNDDEMDIRLAPGLHFSALYNMVEQLRENLRMSSEEAVSAVEDVTAANERVVAFEQRMAKAEKHLCKIWEENCTLRKTMKQKKREKRVLVREIKNLRETAAAARTAGGDGQDPARTFADEFLDASDEEKLISELEEHVISSIRLHEAFLAANGELQADLGGQSALDGSYGSTGGDGDDDALRYLIDSAVKLASDNSDEKKPPSIHPSVPLFEQPKMPVISLFDESEDDSEMSEMEDLNIILPERNAVINNKGIAISRPQAALDDSLDDTEKRPNPLLQLDENDDDEESCKQPMLCPASSQSESSLPGHDNRATSKLSCPLADVVGTTNASTKRPVAMNGELQVYHLTFYSRKIGIQFQKVPPPPVKAKGLLTEAMTDDLAGSDYSSSTVGRTAAELRRVAAISVRAKSSVAAEETMCELATPVDAVLVCGFQGFDDSGSNVRPKLGARLVAFDGVSVEVGKWTFDAVRKAIQARDRPMTLSFRNDFLTTQQRTILTKAVQDVDAVSVATGPLRPPPRNVEHGTPADVGGATSTDPSIRSVLSHESGRSAHSREEEDDLSHSAAGSDYQRSLPQSFSGARSVSSATSAFYRSFGEAPSVSSGRTFRSFSEAGSAASVLSAVAPLVTNLLQRHRQSSSAGPFTPEYLRRPPESVEGTPQHQDFTSQLL